MSNEKALTSKVSKEKLEHELLNTLGQVDASKPNAIVSDILNKLSNLGLFIPVEGVREIGNFPRKSLELLGLAAYQLILNTSYDEASGVDSEIDIGDLDRREWLLLQKVIKALSKHEIE